MQRSSEWWFRWHCTLGVPSYSSWGELLMAGTPPARVGSGGIYSLAIMASANETSVLYKGGRKEDASLLRHCCGRGKDECKRCGKGWACVFNDLHSSQSSLSSLNPILFSSIIIITRQIIEGLQKLHLTSVTTTSHITVMLFNS